MAFESRGGKQERADATDSKLTGLNASYLKRPMCGATKRLSRSYRKTLVPILHDVILETGG